MDYSEIKKRLGMNSRTETVKCSRCGKELTVPNMYREEDLKGLNPYCPTSTVLIVQWILHHGWHVATMRANPPGAYYCPDCFPEGTREFHETEDAAPWCEQAGKWMRENDGKQ